MRLAFWRHPYVRHLRLPFNLLLSPIFLWGAWLGGGIDDPVRALAAYLSLHLFLYGGTNALNSFYDRDEGPIGGMLRPPPVDRGLLAWAWAVQFAGVPLAAWVGGPFLAVWLALLVIATAYSHPRWRWKAHPVSAVAAVAFGQGGLGTLAGWAAVADRAAGFASAADLARPPAALGLFAACALITGLYVVSQIYQTREDRRRGDRTWPVWLGPARALRWGTVAGGIGAVAMLALLRPSLGTSATAAVAVALAALGAAQWLWADRFDEADEEGNFRRAMGLVAVGGSGLTLLLLVLLAR